MVHRQRLKTPPSKVRSRNMRAVRGKDTEPEIAVRKIAHRLGLRFRLHCRNLPGRPDLVFPRWRTVVFVNGCFWHQHRNCRRAKLPRTNRSFWRAKLRRNAERDLDNYSRLRRAGWRVRIVWECNTHKGSIEATLRRWFAK